MKHKLKRPYNFGAGPAMLPDEVLLKAQEELLNWQNNQVSILELGHRTKPIQELIKTVQTKLRQLMQIPDDYEVLFVHGGAQGQFCGIPMNLVGHNKKVDYLVTGVWSSRAYEFAKQYADVNKVVDSDAAFSIPPYDSWCNKLNPDATYLYYCPNETINGIQFFTIPDTGRVPLVADMTSCILSESVDVSKFGLILASAQKNLGVAGVAVVIVRKNLLDQALEITPAIWNYSLLAKMNSSVNTVASFSIYVMDLMLDWVVANGGIASLAQQNKRKAEKLYQFIDSSKFYYNKVDTSCRSILNIPFSLYTEDLTNSFLEQADNAGLKYLAGHMLVGGCRASLYNAMPEAGVDALIEFMQDFAKKNATR